MLSDPSGLSIASFIFFRTRTPGPSAASWPLGSKALLSLGTANAFGGKGVTKGNGVGAEV